MLSVNFSSQAAPWHSGKITDTPTAGIFMLKTLRDRGFNTVIFEAGNDLGGTW